MTQKGKLVTCDRCRRMTFVAENERREYDTKSLNGWFLKDSVPSNIFDAPNADFCPDCYTRFRKSHEENKHYFAQIQKKERYGV